MKSLEIRDLYYNLSNRNVHLRRAPFVVHAEERVGAGLRRQEDTLGGSAAVDHLAIDEPVNLAGLVRDGGI